MHLLIHPAEQRTATGTVAAARKEETPFLLVTDRAVRVMVRTMLPYAEALVCAVCHKHRAMAT